jgi:anthranilate synthase component 1
MPTKIQLTQLAAQYPAVPVIRQFTLTDFQPLHVIEVLRKQGEPCYLLTGKPKTTEDGYTFVGLHPKEALTYRNGVLTSETAAGTTQTKTAIQPALEQRLAALRTPKLPGLPPFTGGLVGYFAYDYAQYPNHTLKPHSADPLGLNDVDLLLVDQVLAYNHATQVVTLSQIVPSADFEQRYDAVVADLAQREAQLRRILDQPAPQYPFAMTTPLQLQFDLPTFAKQVEAAKKHIVAGDIFQLIFSNPQHATLTGSLLAAAPQLFKSSPSPYQFYFQHGEFEAIGASPETLVNRQGTQLFTYPLAGTRRRGKTAAEEAKFANELQTSPKEQSEHNMLVDLGRNDLGRVSQFGSVQVTKLRQLLKFSNVMHLGSTIESEVADDVSAIDIVNALMPAGTLSGAPKVRAMQLIDELENNKRGLYGGCLGYLDYNEDLDMCIGIRLAYRQGDTLVVHSGAGIVADSMPEQEYQEFNNKARSVVNALLTTDKELNANVAAN